MSQLKDDVIKMIQSLPEDCTLEDIQYHLYVRDKVARGLADLEAGRVVSHEEVERRAAEWLKSS
jgi:predicted transcriptional regulator